MDSNGLKKLPRFTFTRGKIADVPKTGLGSSAALITSLVGALLSFYNIVGSKNYCNSTTYAPLDLAFIHNVAQYCHCLAQGKIGSGFDVSAAIWGSHIYHRFSPEILNISSKNVNESSIFAIFFLFFHLFLSFFYFFLIFRSNMAFNTFFRSPEYLIYSRRSFISSSSNLASSKMG